MKFECDDDHLELTYIDFLCGGGCMSDCYVEPLVRYNVIIRDVQTVHGCSGR